MKMTRKFAVPTSNGILDGHFGHCQQFAMVMVEGNSIKEISYLDAPPHQPGMLPPWLAERGATDIIAGGMGKRAIDLFKERGVNVFVGAPAISPEELVQGFLGETLSFSANYCDH
jgi:predicted Fe-Mo cluster-binding NifX family protein